MEVSISRRTLRRLALGLVLPAILIALTLLGRSATPRDASGEPLLLSPSLKGTLEYRAGARAWVEAFRALDGELEALLIEGGDIYHQTQAVDSLLNRSVRLAQDVEVRRAPAALAGLRVSLSATSLAYLDASRAVADWVGAPTPERLEAAQAALSTARELLAQTELNRWLQETDEQGGEELPGPTGGNENENENVEGEEWWTP
ncbi:MAG: hypothetical protein PVF45_09655 [Anaerolineae bacterium]|jgi:hypothetical protein